MVTTVREVPLALPHPAFPEADWGDAFEAHTVRHFTDAEHVARTMMEALPSWANGLMDMRDRIVGPLGLKTGQAMMASPDVECIGVFPVHEVSAQRVILGDDDKHLDFRVAVDLFQDDAPQVVRLSTLVRRNNVLGTGYLTAIMPFHKMIAKALVRSVR